MTDLNFDCPQCGQNLTTDESLSGSDIECPSCDKPITIPAADDPNVKRVEADALTPPVTDGPEPKKIAVPVHAGGEELLKKASSKKEEEITGENLIERMTEK